MLARDIMTKDVAFVSPDAHISDVARLLIERSISGVPVVDADHRPIGMVSEGDLIKPSQFHREAQRQWWLAQLSEGQPLDLEFLRTIQANGRTVRDIMCSPVISVAETVDLAEVAQLIEKHKVKRVLVVRSERMVGLVSRMDIVRAVAAERDASRSPKLTRTGQLVANGTADRPRSNSKICLPKERPTRTIEVDRASLPPAWLLQEWLQEQQLLTNRTADAPRSGSETTVQTPDPLAIGSDMTALNFRAFVQKHETEEQLRREESHRLALELRKQRVKELAQLRLSDRDWREMLEKARKSATEGLKEFMLLRFPSQLCSDGGRAINAPDRNWPVTLRGEPADVFQRWRDELKPRGFQLAAQIVDFPDGTPGDAALFLIWGA